MYCHKCGNKLDENAKFCNMCGAKQTVSPESETVNNNSDITNIKNRTAIKKKSSKIWVVLLIIIVISFIILAVIESLENKQSDYERKNTLNDVKNSHFEFLNDITVGALLVEYYGEDYWECFADDVVQFWGTNKKDNSGLALHFSDVAPDNTVKVTYIKYHNEDEMAHDISEEEFETYILSLYEQLNSKNENTDITTQSETTQTTTTKTTTTTTATMPKKHEQTEESEYYFTYLLFLDEIDRLAKEEYGNMPLRHYNYYLYDINKDGIYELILHVGENEGDSQILIYTINEENEDLFEEIGELDGGHTSLVEKNGMLCTDFRSSGHQVIEEILMIDLDGVRAMVQTTAFEQENLSEYKYYGTELKGYDISDTSAVEKLCPEALLEDKSYLDSYIEEFIDEETPLLTGVVITKTDPLNVRKSPSINAEIIGKVAKGSTVEIYSETNGWCEIRYNGQVGYVSKDFIEYK